MIEGHNRLGLLNLNGLHKTINKALVYGLKIKSCNINEFVSQVQDMCENFFQTCQKVARIKTYTHGNM